VVGSEYIDPECGLGSVVDGVRHEDVQSLTFPDSRFDFLISLEVFEHIPDPDRGLREAFRILCPGGELILTVPFFTGWEQSVRRATFADGKIEYLLPAEYHGNPMVPTKESLVFTDFGWDLLSRMRAAGFEDSYVSFWWSYEYAHLAVNSYIFHALKRSG
jgi:SAM-dependent methyltransferase